MCIFFVFLSSFAPAKTRNELTHTLHSSTNLLQLQSRPGIPIDTVRILALMVEFQQDNNDQTTGNGLFQTTGSTAQIDPPPHDSVYFKNKIRFVENYFHRVSNGILTVTGSVLSQKIVLAEPMATYSPPTTGNDNQKLAELAQKSWQKADSLNPQIDFSRYDLFVIFHAGAGRDIDLLSSLGYNPTPYDIPSLYLDSTAFAAAFAQNSFFGIAVHDSSYCIKNTIILPETESRDIAGEYLQLGMNGLFAASIGSYLGLPDLFDTKTGRSGIGQFGLMDGAGIFAYFGLFPPEPCAWEKMYLGWMTPILVRGTSGTLSVPAVELTASGQDTIYKIPISNSEYFLMENRSRDPQGTGLDITIALPGRDTVRHITADTLGFNYLEANGINGSVVDVSNFDWALIGMTEAQYPYLYDGGGILIWHIDENVIQNGLASNTVNADIDHRGVELKEADGSKDIGQSYETLTAGSGTEYGSPLDCWFQGNPAVLYKNVFDRYSFPNSNSHTGAVSLVTIKDFSVRSPRMTVLVEIDSSILRRNSELSRTFLQTSIYPTATKNHHLYVPANDSIFALKSDGQKLTNTASSFLSDKKSSYGVAVLQQASGEIAASVYDSALTIFHLGSLNTQGTYDSVRSRTQTITQRFSTSPCFVRKNGFETILLGTDSGYVFEFSVDGDLISRRFVNDAQISSLAILPTLSPSQPEEYFCVSGTRIFSEHNSIDLPASSNLWMAAAAVSPRGNFIIAAEKNGNRSVSYSQSLSQKLFDIQLSGSPIQEVAVADIDGDGEKDMIVQSATQVSAFNRIGVLLDGFPIQAKGNNEYTGTPLIIDFDGDGMLEIVAFTQDGEMWVYRRNGKLLAGFPIQVTSSGKSFPLAYTDSSNTIGIAVLSANGSFDAFLSSTKATTTSLAWWQYLGNDRHTNAEMSQTTSHALSDEFMPKSRVYNWPNPVYGRSTQIRCYTSEDAAITITILDLSGLKITELKGRGTAGMDCEIPWDVSNIQSGVYLARVEASGASKKEVAVIKIAVVK
jgi:hypothetical protein